MHPLPITRHLTQAAGALVASLGLLVIIGWLAHWRAIIQVLPGLAPMQFNTALCAFFCGTGLVLLTKPGTRIGPWLTGMAAACGLITLIEYLSGADFGIEQFFIISQGAIAPAHPGRMSPLSATCVLCIALGLTLAGAPRRQTWRLVAGGISACVVATIALVALLGNLLGLDYTYAMGAYSRMAIQTTVALLVLSLGLLHWTWRTLRSENLDLLHWIPKIMAATLVVMIGLISVGVMSDLRNATFLRQRAFQTILAADSYENNLLDIQRGMRGYVTKGDTNALASFHGSAANEVEQFNKLADLTRDDPAQPQRLRDLSAVMASLLSYDNHLIALYEAQGPESALKKDAAGEGRDIFGRIRDNLKAFSTAEQQVLDMRDALEQRDYRKIQHLLVCSCVLAAALLVLASWIASRELDYRRRTEINLTEQASALQRTNAELALQTQRAEAASRLKSEFLANMSHELRTPLHGIRGFSEFLLDQKAGPLNDKQKEFLNDVLHSAHHLSRLINDLLDLAKIEAGRMELSAGSFSIEDTVAEVSSVVKPLAEKKKITLRRDVLLQDAEVSLDCHRVKQVLYNLLSNAIKFTGELGTVEIKVRSLPPRQIELHVIDNGIGIKPEDFRRLFVQFEQLESSSARRYQGTGLGLALTKKIVELHGGTIRVESEIGKGSTFSVVLPRAVSMECKPS